MHRNVKVALGGAALSVGVVVGLPTAALATPICNTYSGTCVIPPTAPPSTPVVGGVDSPGTGGGSTGGGSTGGGSIGGTGGGGGSGAVSSGRGAVNALPFTGDEILVLSLAGAAALAAGTALTVAGRRRGATTA